MRITMNRKWVIYIIGLIILLALIVMPLTRLSGFWIRTITYLFLLIVLAQGWNFIGGYTGYAAFGNVAFFGLGGYGTALLMTKSSWPFFPAMFVGGLIAALYAVLIGLPVLRLRGHYFAIATLGVAEATREVVAFWTPVTGGPAGITLPFFRPVSASGPFFYYLALGLVLLSWLITVSLVRSKLGYGLIAIREDEDAAKMLGINTTWAKVAAFALSAFVTGLAGGHSAYWNTFILPEEVFNIQYSLAGILSTVLGGPGTALGPILGAAIYDLVSTYLTFGLNLGQFHVTILGVFIVLVIIFAPRGVTDFFRGGRRFSLSALLENVRENRV